MATPPHYLLVVDDEPFVGRVIDLQFSRGPFRVSWAGDAGAGLSYLRAHPEVELVLLDIQLPGVSGLDMLAEARQDPSFASVRFVMLTATGQKSHFDRARALGAAGFVTKPFSPNKLYRQICELVGEPVGDAEDEE